MDRRNVGANICVKTLVSIFLFHLQYVRRMSFIVCMIVA